MTRTRDLEWSVLRSATGRSSPAGVDSPRHASGRQVSSTGAGPGPWHIRLRVGWALYEHYGLDHSEQRPDARRTQAGTSDADQSGDSGEFGRDRDRTAGSDTTRATDDAMTRSEERLRVGTRTEEAGRARLRKYVVTEQQSVQRPRDPRLGARIHREPVSDESRRAARPRCGHLEDEHEVTLHQERPVVEEGGRSGRARQAVQGAGHGPGERPTGDVRKEQIDTEGVEEHQR